MMDACLPACLRGMECGQRCGQASSWFLLSLPPNLQPYTQRMISEMNIALSRGEDLHKEALVALSTDLEAFPHFKVMQSVWHQLVRRTTSMDSQENCL
jgi:hypothetical protein